MAIPAKSIIRRVVETLQDPTSIRWPVPELVRYLNDGQREIKLHRPDTVRQTGDIALVPGSRQKLPANADKLIEIWHNKASKRAVQMVDRRILDDQTPGWHALPGSADILHYTYDPRVPTEFFVYPPASGGNSLVGAFSVNPTDIAEPADGSLYAAVTGEIAVIASHGHRLALELECLLMDTKDLPTVSRWWDTGMSALTNWQNLFPYDGPRIGE